MVTKRQLGIAVIAFSAFFIIGIMAVDLFSAGQWSGFGPLQRIGVGLGVSAILVGGILVRLGDRPA
jgi:heme A synthase